MAQKPEVIGLFGVGLLGSAIADRLTASGVPWIGYDPARPDLAPNPEAVIAQAETIILCLPTSAITAQLIPQLTNKTIIDTTTGDPAQMAGFAAANPNYLDVTIGGSSAHLRSGQAILMAGATPEAFAAALPLLTAISPKVFHCGAPGAGAQMKLVFNLVLGLNRAALAEGLAFAEHCGINATTALEILQAGPAASAIMARKGPKMIAREYTPEARLAQHHKDVRLIQAEAEKHGLQLPLSTAHAQILERAEQLGHAENDNSALIEAYRNDSVSNE
jgi:3-hydroxyisobutyrate dehydrogenase-like beta-hydroxyacid dehydrogenase